MQPIPRNPSAKDRRDSVPSPTRVKADLDVYGAITYMYKAQHQGVRDYLVNQLYEMPLKDIDFTLPQLCNLVMVWSEAESASLQKFLVDKCSHSIHLGVKLVWLLNAEATYCTDSRKDRCLKLLESCEEAVVNSRIEASELQRVSAAVRRKSLTQQSAAAPSAAHSAHSGAQASSSPRVPTSAAAPAHAAASHSSHSSSSAPSSSSSSSSTTSTPSPSATPAALSTLSSAATSSSNAASIDSEIKDCLLTPHPQVSISFDNSPPPIVAPVPNASPRIEIATSENKVPTPTGSPSLPADLPCDPKMIVAPSPPTTPRQADSLIEETLRIGVEKATELAEKAALEKQKQILSSQRERAVTPGSPLNPSSPNNSSELPSSSPTDNSSAHLSVPTNNRGGSSASSEQKTPAPSSPKPSTAAARSSSPAPVAAPLSSSSQSIHSTPSNPTTAAPSTASPTSPANPSSPSSPSDPESKQEAAALNPADLDRQVMLEVFLAKQVRSEYFNAELTLLSDLEQISNALVVCPREQRTMALRGYIAALTQVASGTYFPNCGVEDPHYKVLRIPPNEAIALNSRDKAPFLLFVEILFTHRRCGAVDIYKSFDVGDVTERKTLYSPHYDPIDVNDHATYSMVTLDAHIQPRYFSPEAQHAPKREVPRGSLDGVAMEEMTEDDHEMVWVSITKDGAVVESPSETNRLLGPAGSTPSPVRSGSLSHSASAKELSSMTSASSSSSTVSSIPAPTLSTAGSTLTTSASSRRLPSNDSTRKSSAGPNGSPRTNDEEGRNRRTMLLAAFGESWSEKKARLRQKSPYGGIPGWDMKSIIFKGGDDCRQEALAMQLIMLFDEIFQSARLPLKLRPYFVLVTSPNSGLIETVPNTVSIDSLKKNVRGFTTLAKFFQDSFGGGNKNSPHLRTARANFVESMAAYSVVSYLLQFKDRHNGNILLDNEGHIIHIDFGFMLSNSPGRNMNWEASPFKLTREYVEVMEGEDSESFQSFKLLVLRGFLEARKHAHKILSLVEISMLGSNMACFCAGPATLTALKERLLLSAPEEQVMENVMTLIDESVDHWTSQLYDNYQRMTNGIL